MKGLKPTLVAILAIGLLTGSAVGAAAQDEAAEGAEPTDPIEPEPTMEPLVTPDTGGAVLADARVIDLATSGLQFTGNGEQVLTIPVTPGESVVFRVDNTEGIHNFYIGTDEQLSTPPSQEDLIAFVQSETEAGRDVDMTTLVLWPTTDVGIPNWETGVQHVEWLVSADITDLKFGCTLLGHYLPMQGTFSVSP